MFYKLKAEISHVNDSDLLCIILRKIIVIIYTGFHLFIDIVILIEIE